MSSAFINLQPHHRTHCSGSNNCIADFKLQYEAPKQLLQLRSQVKPLIPRNRASNSCVQGAGGVVFSRTHSPLPYTGKTIHLDYIEKDKRVHKMIPQQHQYHAYDRPFNYHSRKMTISGPPLMRTPSSGFSSASSSENMFSGLSLADTDQKIHEIMDPSVDVDLDMFLLPEVRYKQPVQPSTSTSRGNLSQISGSSQIGGSMRQIAASQAKSAMPNSFADYSYANVKRSNGYIDYMPTTYCPNTVSQPSVPSVPISPRNCVRCQFCWETYVKLCQQVSTLDPVVSCDGPWHWHSLYDGQGRVACPRLWFTQLDRAGSDMVQQMANSRKAQFWCLSSKLATSSTLLKITGIILPLTYISVSFFVHPLHPTMRFLLWFLYWQIRAFRVSFFPRLINCFFVRVEETQLSDGCIIITPHPFI